MSNVIVRQHDLKTLPEFFEAVLGGSKTFEIRKDDRGFKVGDILTLNEWRTSLSAGPDYYTGRILNVKVTYKMSGGRFGLADGYCILGIVIISGTNV